MPCVRVSRVMSVSDWPQAAITVAARRQVSNRKAVRSEKILLSRRNLRLPFQSSLAVYTGTVRTATHKQPGRSPSTRAPVSDQRSADRAAR